MVLPLSRHDTVFCFFWKVLSQKSCRTKVPRNFRIFVPEFLPNFPLNFPRFFLRIFRALFPRKRRPQKIRQKPPPFCNGNSPGKKKKNNSQHLERRQSKKRLHRCAGALVGARPCTCYHHALLILGLSKRKTSKASKMGGGGSFVTYSWSFLF